MSTRTISHPRINVEHSRYPQLPTAYLWASAGWLKNDIVVQCGLTEGELVDLAEECLKAAIILRRSREELAAR